MRHPFGVFIFALLLCLASPLVSGQPVNPQPLAPNSDRQGQLTQEAPTQWYSITLTEPGSLTVEAEAEGELRLQLRLLDANGTSNLHSDASGTRTERTVEHKHLNPGTYFVVVQRATGAGPFTIRSSFAQSSQPGDARPGHGREQPHALSLGQHGTGLLGYYHAGGTDTDAWFVVTLAHPGTLRIEVSADPTLSIAAQLFDINGTSSLQNQAAGTASHRVLEYPNLNPGTYYVQVRRSSGYGRYTVVATSEIQSQAADALPGNTREQAYPLDLVTSSSGLLGFYSGGQTDTAAWFEVTTTEPGQLRVHVDAADSLQIAAQLFDINRTSSLHNDAAGTSSTRTVQQANLNPGTYYVQVRRSSGHGRYTIRAEFTSAQQRDDVVPDNTRDTAYLLPIGQQATGLLGFYSGGQTDTTAWFQVTTSEPGQLQVDVDAAEGLLIAAQLFDSNATSSLHNDAAGSSAARSVGQVNLNPGTYFIQVRRASGFGRFFVNATFTSAARPNDHRPENTRETPHQLPLFQEASGLLGYYNAGRTDGSVWYAVEMTEPGALHVRIDAAETLSIAAQLFDTNRTSSLHNDAAGTSSQRLLHYANLNPGTYYVQVRRAGGYGRYTVHTTPIPFPDFSGRWPAADLDQAPHLPPGTSSQGILGLYSGGTTQTRSWYQIPVTSSGPLLVHAVAEDSLTITGRLSLAGRVLGSDQAGTSRTRMVQIDDAIPEIYSWELTRAGGYGAYHIAVSQESRGFLTNPVNYDFGPVQVGETSSAMSFALINLESAEQTGFHVQLQGDQARQFKLHNDDISGRPLTGRDYNTVQVAFQPTSSGEQRAELQIHTPQGSKVVSVVGQGYTDLDDPTLGSWAKAPLPVVVDPTSSVEEPTTETLPEAPVPAAEAPPEAEPGARLSESPQHSAPTVQPTHHLFPATAVGQRSETITIQVSNPGSETITIWELQWRGGDASHYRLMGTDIYETPLPAGASLAVDMAYEPQDAGVHWAMLEIYTDSGTLYVPVQGKGQ